MYPSCTPTLQDLIACCGAQIPRFYSIASSPLYKRNIAAVAFSCVRYVCHINEPVVISTDSSNFNLPESESKGNSNHLENVENVTHTDGSGSSNNSIIDNIPLIRRKGVCTGYLERILKHKLNTTTTTPSNSDEANSNQNTSEDKIKVFLKPTTYFRPPGSASLPLILIGPGTGIAPFIGFLQHRTILKNERDTSGGDICTGLWRGGYEIESTDLPHEDTNVAKFIKSAPEGPIMLFFGCRNTDDYLYKDELMARYNDGTITTLEVAMSRVGGSGSGEKTYVTHKLLSQGSEG